MVCRRCGEEIPEGSRYCPRCGEPAAGTPAEGAPGQSGADAVSSAARKVARDAADAAIQGVQAAADRLSEAAGGSGHVDLRFADFFDQVFKHHGRGEAEEIFVCGTPSTTPAPRDISRDWPHPWLYSRVFLVLFIALAGLWIVMGAFKDDQGIAGFALVASLLMNLSMVTFFFETNAPRNVSFPLVLAVFLLGGVLSLVVSSPFYGLVAGEGESSWFIGAVVGEVAKIAVLAAILPRLGRGSYVLTGVLIGSAVGAGYSVFSAIGDPVGTVLAVSGASTTGMLSVISDALAGAVASRVVAGLGYHAALGAIEGGALMLAGLGDGKGRKRAIDTGVLVPFLGISGVFAALWNVEIPLLSDVTIPGLYLEGMPAWASTAANVQGAALTVAAWVVIVVLLQRGIQQVNEIADGAQEGPEEG